MHKLMEARLWLFLGVLVVAAVFLPTAAPAQVAVGVSITVAPPVIPVYEQPPCPTEGYMWTPGYWAYGPDGYYWVPGVWLAPPRVGFLWTPGYWGFVGGAYRWHAGYWGPHVGFYGGINYGFGYGGVGFVGGAWRGGVFAYNTAVWHVGGGFRNVYVDRTVIRETNVTRVSYNGHGGVERGPSAEERGYMREEHVGRTQGQISHQGAARVDRGNYVSVNHGTPAHPEGMGVNARQDRQQNRINQGAHSGQLTKGETNHIEHNETAIHNEVKNDRAANGGHLTQQEHHQVEHQQNKESRQIYRDKHNGRTDANPHPHGGGSGGGHEHAGHEHK